MEVQERTGRRGHDGPWRAHRCSPCSARGHAGYQPYGQLVAWDHCRRARPGRPRFQWDWATVKFDWALERPVPWLSTDVAAAGTVHLADSIDELTRCCADLSTHMVPARPFRAARTAQHRGPHSLPAGTESLYGYTHGPRRVVGDAGDGSVEGVWDPADLEPWRTASRDGSSSTPGFSEPDQGPSPAGAGRPGRARRKPGRWRHQRGDVRHPPATDVPARAGLGRPETPVAGLYLASSSAHPGGGVHGACGANAARAALMARRPFERLVVKPALTPSAWDHTATLASGLTTSGRQAAGLPGHSLRWSSRPGPDRVRARQVKPE